MKQPLGSRLSVKLPTYVLPTAAAALAHAASETIFEKPDGQSVVLDAPYANPAHNGARNGPRARCPLQHDACMANAGSRRNAGAIERVRAQVRPRCAS